MLLVLCISRLGLGFQFQTMGSASESVLSEMGLNYTEVGTLIGLFMLPGLFLAIPAGYSARFASDRWLTGVGLLLLGLGGALAAVADNFGLLALGRLACGAGFVFSTLYFTKMVAEWFAGRELATAMSLLVMTWPLGIAMGQIGHEWLTATFEWRSVFAVAAAYCLAASLVIVLTYRAPPGAATSAAVVAWRLPRRELFLTLLASFVWALFNAGYVVYLSFAPKVLTASGYSSLEAAATTSIASWLMIFSGALCGHIADRTGRKDLILYICMTGATVSLLMLPLVSYAVVISAMFGLVGAAPAGVIMALTGEAMSAERRAFAMGVFLTSFFVLTAPAPAIAGFLYDLSGDPYWPIVFGAGLFAATAGAYAVFRASHRRYADDLAM